MATRTNILRVRFSVDGDGRVKVALADTGRQFEQLDRAASRSTGAFSRMRGELFSLRGALASLGIAFTVREIIRLSDTMTLLNARVRLFTDTTEEAAMVQEGLFNIAQRSRTALDAVTEMYARLAQGRKEMQVSNDQLLRFVETLTKLQTVSGASGQEGRNAIIQLSQGLASGELRGEELRSVIEQLPALVDVVVDRMNAWNNTTEFTRGKFRELAFQGKITTDIIVAAVLEASEETDARFSQIPVTIGGAFQQIANTITQQMGDLRGSGDAINNLVGSIQDLNATLGAPAVVEGIQTFASGLITLVELAVRGASAFADFGTAIGEAFARAGGVLTMEDELEKINKQIDRIHERLQSDFLFENQEKALNQALGPLIRRRDELRALLAEFSQPPESSGEDGGEPIQRPRGAGGLLGSGGPRQFQSLGEMLAPSMAQAAVDEWERTMRDAARVIEETRTPLERYNNEMQRLNQLLLRGAIDQETFDRAAEAAKEAMEEAEEAARKASDQWSVYWDQAARNMQDALGDALFQIFSEGEFHLDNLLKSFSQILARMAAEAAAAQIFDAFTSDSGGSFWANLLGDGKAGGGDVSRGKLYPVNERGIEMLSVGNRDFLMMGAGQGKITPHNQLRGGGMNVVINAPVNAQGAMGADQIFAAAGLLEHRLTALWRRDILFMQRYGKLP